MKNSEIADLETRKVDYRNRSWFSSYIEAQTLLLKTLTYEEFISLVGLIRKAMTNRRRVIICGNGGSLSNSQHFICDFNKGVGDRLNRALCQGIVLGSNPALFSACGNDYRYSDVFVRELDNLNPGEGDIVIGLSVSGKSRNVIKALKFAKEGGATTIAIVGNGDCPMRKYATQVIHFDSEHFGRVEDCMMILLHMITYYFMENGWGDQLLDSIK